MNDINAMLIDRNPGICAAARLTIRSTRSLRDLRQIIERPGRGV
jgi:hypothetical protein